MLRQLFTATAAVVLVAGCSGNNADSKSGDGGQSSTTAATPTTPAATQYDPPKAFTAVAAAPTARDKQRITFEPIAGMAGLTAVVNSLSGLYGQGVTEQVTPWQVPAANAASAATTETIDASKPMTVQVDGKEAVAVVYYQRVKGSGTNKSKVQVAFRWVDPANGKIVSEATIDVTPVIGAQEVTAGLNGGFTTETFDAATGQIAVGLTPASLIGAKAGIFSVFADPKTKKTGAVPFLEPAGVSNGVVVGAKGPERDKRVLAIADAVTGAVKKTGLQGVQALGIAGAGQKHIYMYSSRYVSTGQISGYYTPTIYAIDPATGAIVETKSTIRDDNYPGVGYTCLGDSANTVVCVTDQTSREREIIGIDDTTGKKTWGYTEATGGRVVPTVTTVFHGVVYAAAETGPILLNALTGQDLPTPTPTPTPTDGTTPGAPTDSASPIETPSPTDGQTLDESSLDAKPQSPTAVSVYGGAYLKKSESITSPTAGTLQVLRAIG